MTQGDWISTLIASSSLRQISETVTLRVPLKKPTRQYQSGINLLSLQCMGVMLVIFVFNCAREKTNMRVNAGKRKVTVFEKRTYN